MYLSATDRKVLNCIQEDIPLDPKPFKILAERVDMDEEKFIERVRSLKESGIIRKFSAGLNHKKLNFVSTLVGMRVAGDEVENVARDISAYKDVTHCYLREGEFNLWAVFISSDKEKMEAFLSELKARLGRENVLNLSTKKKFKLRTNLCV